MVQNSGNRARINFMKTDLLVLVKEAIEKKIPEAGNQPFAVFDFDIILIFEFFKSPFYFNKFGEIKKFNLHFIILHFIIRFPDFN